MKTGYLRIDQEGNFYLIPESITENFDNDLDFLDGIEYKDLLDAIEEFEEFDRKYLPFKVERDLYKTKIIIDNENN